MFGIGEIFHYRKIKLIQHPMNTLLISKKSIMNILRESLNDIAS
ncbi:transposase B transposon PsiTn554 [Staphylococcus aureus DAR3163]|nr:transposase B transposon PsiTn554 [Staphylococcus aureus DAR3163]